ncbi:MAG: GntR family transcriptional regulator [Anaerolineales bacterium]|nr:GntR family transcriptional regulator [Anaerolineales bacterium]
MPSNNLERKPLKEEIFDALHRQIIAGEYAPGDWLRQVDIASQMGVSMTPVREALDLLVASGLAERVAYRGARVREMSPKDIVEAYGLRLILEALVAKEAAKNITPEEIKGLEKIIEEMQSRRTLEETPRIRQMSREFHARIAEASRNALLINLYAVAANAFPDWLLYEKIFRNPNLLEDNIETTQKEHSAIVEALKKKDAEKAAKKSIAHLMESGKWIRKYLDVPAELVRGQEEQASFLVKKK